jgi:ubiquitin carboxyl-terminal hydrolase L3
MNPSWPRFTSKGPFIFYSSRNNSSPRISSNQGQTEVPEQLEDVDLHFICLIPHQGRLYELDGRKIAPVDHGPIQDVTQSCAAVVKAFMAREPENLNFTLLGLAPRLE